MESKVWFGALPPDLTLMMRRASGDGSGADWLYTYLRQFLPRHRAPDRLEQRRFENVGMPHVFWGAAGRAGRQGHRECGRHEKGRALARQAGQAVGPGVRRRGRRPVSFLVWMGEPVVEKRKSIGIVLRSFAGMFVLSYALKKNYWKDIH